MLTPYGYNNAFLMLGIAAVLILLGVAMPWAVTGILLVVLGAVFAAFTLWFFRDPERNLHPSANGNPDAVVSPADGVVMEVELLQHHPYTQAPTLHITIFLSPVDLHVNRYPVSGTIVQAEYVPGKYLMAFNPKSSDENERSVFTAVTPNNHTVVFTQITGFLARRVVYDTKRGDNIHAGQRFGMMKFGSRMDLFLPATSMPHVTAGQRVVSASSLIATLGGKAQ
jgi:phosphatidylserine decarboxylase